MVDFLKKTKKVHLIGVGGEGMSGLACLLQDRGFTVQGSDILRGAKTEKLKKRGIKVFNGHKSGNIGPEVGLVCYSSAIGSDNVELAAAAGRRIKVVKRGELLAYLCRNIRVIAVAGSHGKTTVVSLLSYLFRKAGYRPAVFIGGLPADGSLPAVWGRDYAIIETDESDGTFLSYRPFLSVITNIDREHTDYYQSFRGLKKSFLTFARNTSGKTFGGIDSPEVQKVIKDTGGISFGLCSGSCFRAGNIRFEQGLAHFDLFKKGKFFLSLSFSLPGRHNCLNLLAALSVLDYLGIDLKKIKKHLTGFQGTRRRFQIRENFSSVIFVDDYAHHPTEIKAALDSARLLSSGRLVALLQPHRPSRLKALFSDFISCLEGADKVIITDIYQASETSLEGVSGFSLAEAARKRGLRQAEYVSKGQLKQKVPVMLKENDLVISLGAGDIDKELEKIIYGFKKKQSSKKC